MLRRLPGVQGRYTGESLFRHGARKAAGHRSSHAHSMDPFEWTGAPPPPAV